MLPSGLPEVPSDPETERASPPPALRPVGRVSASWPGLDPGLPRVPGDAAPGASSRGVEHVHRGSHKDGEGAIPPALQEVLRNLRATLEQPLDVQMALDFLQSRRRGQTTSFSMFLDRALALKPETKVRHVSRTEAVLGSLTGMSARSLQVVFKRLRSRDGRATEVQGAGGRPKRRIISAGEPEQPTPCPVDEASGDILEDLVVDVAGIAGAAATGDSRLSQNLSLDPRSIALRLGAMVARIYVEPQLPVSAYTPMISFLDAVFPGCVGELNHGERFCKNLGRCMAQHLQQCIALEHWAKVPALQIPSDYARIIDGYTVEGEPCQVIVHIVTRTSGELDWLLIDIAPNSGDPVLGNADGDRHQQWQTYVRIAQQWGIESKGWVDMCAERGFERQYGTRVGMVGDPWGSRVDDSRPEAAIHKFKKGKPLARIVRRSEGSYLAMNDSEALARHAVTCADGQYIGPYGNNFMGEWCELVVAGSKQCACPLGQDLVVAAWPGQQGSPSAAVPDSAAAPVQQSAAAPVQHGVPAGTPPLPVFDSSCEFHLLQNIGRDVDRLFPDVAKFEHLLRDLKSEFADGASRLYLRGAGCLLGKKVKALLAPRVDNFKVTLYSRGFHTRFLYHYDVLYKALGAKLSANYQNQQLRAWARYDKATRAVASGSESGNPKRPSVSYGLRVQESRALRTLGQRMTDPFLIVFGLGRGDLRDVFLSAYSTLTQDFKTSSCVKVRSQQEMRSAMRVGIHHLTEMVGALRLLEFVALNPKPGSDRWHGAGRLRLHIKVLCAHWGWRYVPNVVRILPDILVARNFDRTIMGMPIKPRTSPFMDPVPKKVADREPHRALLRSSESPKYWWSRVLDALSQLVRFLQTELAFFESRFVDWDLDGKPTGAGSLVTIS